MQPPNKTQQITVNVTDLPSSDKCDVIHVLHVDDDPSALKISEQMLMMEGNFEINHAECVDEAFKKLETQTFDVVISDYEMPQKDGLQFLKELREQKNPIPFILFTGKGREEVAIKALNLGADGYYNKQGSPETVYGELAHGIRLVTERYKAKRAVYRSEERYRDLVNFLPEVVFEADLTGKITFFSQGAFRTSGFTKEEIEGKNVLQFIVPEERKRAIENMKKSSATENPVSNEHTLIRKNGSTCPVLIRTSPIILENKVTGLRGIVVDITERKKAEEATVQNNLKINRIIDTISDGVYVLDRDWNFVYVNKRMGRLVDSEPCQMIGKSCWQLFPKWVGTICEQNLRDAMFKREFKRFEWQGLYSDDVWEINVFPSEEGITVNARNIAEQKKAEEALRHSEQKYREFADSLPEIVFETDERGRPTFVNRKAAKILGYSTDEIKQANFVDFLVPEDRQRAMKNVQRIKQGEKLKGNEYTLRKKDGTKFPAIVFTESTLTATGAQGLRGIIVDMSNAKEAAEKLALANEKLRVVGSLTRHDVRNKLGTITCYSYILKKRHADQADIVEGLDKIIHAAKASCEIFDFAKMYEQLRVEELSLINVKHVADQALELFSEPVNVKVINECGGLSLLADSFLRQMFYNLMDNTRKYGEKATTVRIYCERKDEADLKLIYEDDGVGISAENKPKLFREGFSTGHGTGFGMFLIKKMLEAYGWSIEENGEIGKGARFQITIPKYNRNGKENYRIGEKEPKQVI